MNGIDEIGIVDCDVHVMRPEAVQAHKGEYVPMPHRVQVDPGAAGAGGGYPTQGQIVHSETFDFEFDQTEDGGIVEIDRDLREAHLDPNGIDVPILNMGPLSLDEFPEVERRRQEMHATNNTLLDRFLDEDDELRGLASISPSLATDSAEEIDRLADEDGIVGLYTDISYLDPPFGDERYDPVFEAAADAGFPLVLHAGESCVHAPNLYMSVDTHAEMYTTGPRLGYTVTLASLLYHGVPVRHPDVEFVCLGAGPHFVADLIGQLNHDYGARPFDAPLLDEPPEKYLRDQFYFSTQPLPSYADPEITRSMVEFVGADSLVYASNYPLFDMVEPEAAYEWCTGFDDDEIEAIFSGNATELFGLN